MHILDQLALVELKDTIDEFVNDFKKNTIKDVWDLEINVFNKVMETFYGPDFVKHLYDLEKNNLIQNNV